MAEAISTPFIRLRYTKDAGPGDVVHVSVNGQRQSTLKLADAGAAGRYGITPDTRLAGKLPAGSHTIKLELQSARGALEVDYFVIHGGAAQQGR